MWTPRRILLLLVGLAGFVGSYLVYAQLLGGVDGLPQLPDAYLIPAENQPFELSPTRISPTYRRLEEAFGPNSPEVIDNTAYKTRLELRDRGIVFACGPMEFSGTNRVVVSPFSAAFFGKVKPSHLLQPGEVREISTFHADRAELEFDRPVQGPQDLSGKNPAKMVGMDLFSVPDMLTHDVRRGQIWMTNNQKSADPGQFLIFRTPGPLYYRAVDGPAAAQSPEAPQVWTHARVEIIDRKNLPRPLRSTSTATVPTRGDEFRKRDAVADILLGVTLPPPTMTADGMKVYLERQSGEAKTEKRNNTGYSGVKMIELTEKVQVNLWSDGGSAFPGSTPTEGVKPPVAADPPAGAAALLGGTVDGAAVARQFTDKTLMVIETLGPFRYDFQTSRARFEAAAVAPEAVSNHVTATRVSATGAQDNLICKLLVIDFFEDEAAASPGDASKGAAPRPRPGEGGRKIKSLTATGPHVYISLESEHLQAQGTELVHTNDPKGRRSETILRGAPVYAERERNRLMAGRQGAPAEVFLASIAPPPGSKEPKKSHVEVRGPGRIDMYDEAAKGNTLQASWGRSLTHEKEKVGEVEQDLLKFEGGGTFADTKGGMDLSAERLWLWLAPADPKSASVTPGDPSKALPQRLLAVNRVEGRNADLVIGLPDQPPVDQLTVWFRDVPPPAEPTPPPPAKTPDPAPPTTTPTPPTPPVVTAEPPVAKTEPPAEKPKPPVKVASRLIESWVVRYPVQAAPAKPEPKAPAVRPGATPTTLKYELERARCEDRVVVHQDPEDPLQNPRGLDIAGAKLNIDQSRAGGVLTVTAPPQGVAEVHFEATSIFGPVVIIDQPNNVVAVPGDGRLVMPSESDFTGNTPSRPSEMEVRWQASMRFEGAKSRAEFIGQVRAVQRPVTNPGPARAELAPPPRILQAGYRADPDAAITARPPATDDGTWTLGALWCHQLNVTFDRPIYFNNYRRTGKKPSKPGEPSDNPKLKTARCTPMADDEADKLPPAEAKMAKRVYYQEETFNVAGRRIKAQRIDSVHLDVKNDEREQVLLAEGPGEVRLLQAGSKSEYGPTGNGRPAASTTPPPPSEQELKLTIVRFTSRMTGRDKAKLYQEAIFDDGGRVWQVPTEDLNYQLVEHAKLPERGVHLSCTTSLKVSSSRAKKDAPAEQWMTALGNASFKDTKYLGEAQTIVHDGQATTLIGSERRLASLWQIQRNINDQPGTTAQQIKYYKDGRIEVAGSGTGTFQPNR